MQKPSYFFISYNPLFLLEFNVTLPNAKPYTEGLQLNQGNVRVLLSLINLNLHAHDRIIQLIVVPEAHLLDYPIDSTGVLSHQIFHCSFNCILHFFGGTHHCQTLSNDQFIFELMCIKFKFGVRCIKKKWFKFSVLDWVRRLMQQ